MPIQPLHRSLCAPVICASLREWVWMRIEGGEPPEDQGTIKGAAALVRQPLHLSLHELLLKALVDYLFHTVSSTYMFLK